MSFFALSTQQDEKRMEKLQKRLEQLELISNNTKLLSELLAHYGAASGEQEKLLMKVGPSQPTPEPTVMLF